jgi:hypothetical protein
MDEKEWLECKDPETMLMFLRDKTSARKLRLYAVGCCHQHDALVFSPNSLPYRRAVQLAEQFAEGRASVGMLLKERRREDRRWNRSFHPSFTYFVVEFDALAAARRSALYAHLLYKEDKGEKAAEELRRAQSDLVRCIFGNPFRPVAVDMPWLASIDRTASKLAVNIYIEHAFDRLPLLADALEEAGCDNKDILNHCRGSGPHGKGCWVLDLLLGEK